MGRIAYFGLLWILVCQINFGQAQSPLVALGESGQVKQLLPTLEYWHDTTGTLSLEEAINIGDFQAVAQASEEALYTSGTYTTWFRFRVENLGPHQNFLLYVHDYEIADIYYQDKWEETIHIRGGCLVPMDQRFIFTGPYTYLPLYLAPQESQTVFFRVRMNTRMGQYIHRNFKNFDKFSIQLAQPIIRHSKASRYVQGAFFGIAFIMFLYNLILFQVLKIRSYLYFALYLLLISFSVSGNYLFLEVFFPESPLVVRYSTLQVSFLPAFAFIIFSIQYLRIKKLLVGWFYPLWGFASILGFLWLIEIITYQVFRLNLITYIISTLLCLVVSILVWYKKFKPAWYFILANAIYLLSLMLLVYFALQDQNLATYAYLSSIYLPIFGYLTQILLIAIGLNSRNNALRTEVESKMAEQQQFTEHQKEYLELEVRHQTHQIQAQSKVLQNQNDELLRQREEIQSQRDFMSQQNDKLMQVHKQLTNSIKAALTIQESILPDIKIQQNLLGEHFIIYRPRDEVSGDFYWLNEVKGKRILAVVDCTGYGVPGAFMSLIGHLLLDKIVRVWKIVEPAKILSYLHQEVRSILRQKETGNNYGMDISLICWEQLNEEITEVTFAGAKLSLYYLKPGNEAIKTFKGSRKSIGGIQNPEVNFRECTTILEKGSLIYMGTDGLTDQNDEKRKRFGEDQVINLLLTFADTPLLEQKFALEKALDHHMRYTSQRDDILWIGFKI